MIAATTALGHGRQLRAHLGHRLGRAAAARGPRSGGPVRGRSVILSPANKCDVVVHVASDRSLRPGRRTWSAWPPLTCPLAAPPDSGRVALRDAPPHGSPRPRSPRWSSTTSSTSSTRCAPGADLRGRIVSVAAETAESATILIKPGRDWNGHVPGQYVRIGVDVDGVRLWRTYSLTHGPRADRCISITVKAIPDGVVSNYLVHRARAGQMLQLEQAEGEFVLPAAAPRQAAAGHRRLRHHPGHRDAAQPVLRADAGRRPTSCCVHVNAHRVRPRSSATSCARTATAGRITPDRAVRRRRDGLLDVAHLDDLVPDLDRARWPTPAARPACSTRSRSTTPSAASPCTTERFRPTVARGRRGRHAHLRRRHRRRGRRRHADPRRRRGAPAS